MMPVPVGCAVVKSNRAPLIEPLSTGIRSTIGENCGLPWHIRLHRLEGGEGVFAVATFVQLDAKTKQVEKPGIVAVIDAEWCPQRFIIRITGRSVEAFGAGFRFQGFRISEFARFSV
jgi:hypothetical protein